MSTQSCFVSGAGHDDGLHRASVSGIGLHTQAIGGTRRDFAWTCGDGWIMVTVCVLGRQTPVDCEYGQLAKSHKPEATSRKPGA
jgi:hypothetical protein